MFNETEWDPNVHQFPRSYEAERRKEIREDEEGRWPRWISYSVIFAGTALAWIGLMQVIRSL